ncbi:MAG: hypothetical protein ABSB78_09560 [Bacteroidota bacterium]
MRVFRAKKLRFVHNNNRKEDALVHQTRISYWFMILFFCICVRAIVYGQNKTDQVISDRTSNQLQPTAQTTDSSSLLQKAFSFYGDVGTYGELYGVSGIEKRRPSATGRIFFRPTISIFNTLTFNFDLLFSTEGNAARQSMNQIAVHPEWSWGRAHAGDFGLQLSELTMNGVPIRGGGLELYPGLLRFMAVGGMTKRAVEGNVVDASFDRVIAGMKLGIGREGGDFFDINVVRAWDIGSSLPPPQNIDSLYKKDSTNVIDSLYATTENDAFVTTPQENLVAGISTGFSVFDGMVKFSGEAAGSLYTSDMNAAGISDSSSLKLKAFKSLNSLYHIRLSTSADYALKTQLSLNFRVLNIHAGFTRIGTSYTSLGLASQINDRQGVNFGLMTQFLDGAVVLTGNYDNSSDNLVKQKLYTTNRSSLTANLGLRPSAIMYVMLVYRSDILGNDATNDTMKIDNKIASYMANVSFFFTLGTISNTLTLSGAYQNSNDGNILRAGYNTGSTNLMVNISSALSADLSVSPFVGFTGTKTGETKTNLMTFGGGLNYRVFDGKLNNNISISANSGQEAKNISIQLQSSYPIWMSDAVSLSLRYTNARGTQTNSFKESLASLTWTHRF